MGECKMKNIKNFQPYLPENPIFGDEVLYLLSEDGQDWYAVQQEFELNSIKFEYDDTGEVVRFSQDISLLFPQGRSVVEIPLKVVSNLDLSQGRWRYDGKRIVPILQTQDDLISNANRQKQDFIQEATNVIAPLQDAIDLEIATEKETAALQEWKKYRVLLNRVDTSLAPNIDWPEKPE